MIVESSSTPKESGTFMPMRGAPANETGSGIVKVSAAERASSLRRLEVYLLVFRPPKHHSKFDGADSQP